MASYRRRKGQIGQNEVIDLLRDNGLDVQAVDASGSIKREHGDIILRIREDIKWNIEVKREKELPIAGMEKRKADSEILVMRQNNDSWKAYMEFDLLVYLLMALNNKNK